MSVNTKKLGQQIKKLRLEQGLSQEDLAGLAEIDRSFLSEIENGKKNPSFESLLRISEALQVKLSSLLKPIGF